MSKRSVPGSVARAPALLLVLLLAGPLHAQVIVRPIELPEQTAAVALVRFTSGGHLDAAARGLAITDAAGEGVPYRLVAHDPAGETWLAFRPAPRQRYTLRYSPKPLKAARTDESIQPSLVLQTFALERGNITEPRELARVVASQRPLGTTLVQNISFAHNPFGSPHRFATLVQGLLKIEQPGTYRFFSVSDDASFIEIDGAVIIAQPAARVVSDQERLARESVAVRLEAGERRVRYLQAQADGQALGILGMAEDDRAFIIPADRFVHHPVAELGAASIEDGRAAVGFDAEQLDQLGYDGQLYTRFAFRPIAPAPRGATYRWTFGDGTGRTASTADDAPEHVFVQADATAEDGGGESAAGAPAAPGAPGVPGARAAWTVKLELVEGRQTLGAAAAVVSPAALGDVATIDNAEQVEAYAAAMAKADYARATPELMAALYNLAAVTEKPAAIAAVAAPFVERFGERGGPLVWEVKQALASHLASSDPGRAAELFAELARGAPDSWHATAATAQQLELMILRLGEGEAVEARVNQTLGGKRPRERALLKSKIGDAHRAAGRYERAAEAYRAAQQETYRALDARQAAVLESAHRETALAYLRQERYPALREQLLQWEADFPSAKLGGDLPLIAARYYQAIGDDARAAAELRALLAMNPLHPSTPEATFRLGQSLLRLGEAAEARTLFERVAKQFPNSPFARQAEDALAQG